MSDKVTGGQLISDALKLEGVNTVFTLAGDHILPALDILHDEDVRIIDTRHEQAAVHMSDAWGRITGDIGVVMYTTPGFANAIPGIANALHAESPLLSISGSAPLHELGRGAMQEIDQIGMSKPITKGSWMVTDIRRIPQMISHAIRVAYSGRRGPVHLTIPVDLQMNQVSKEDVPITQTSERQSLSSTQGSPGQIEDTIQLLLSANRPLIIAGSAAANGGSGESLQRLVETTKLPLMTEGSARGLVSDNHPQSLGFFDSGLNRAARLLRTSDVILILGKRQDIIIGYAMPPTISTQAKIIQVDPAPDEIGRNRAVTIGVVGDVSTVTNQLADEAEKHEWTERPWLTELRTQRKAQRDSLESISSTGNPMHAMEVHKVLAGILRPDDILVFDGGDFCHFGRAYLPSRTPYSWWYVSTLGMLGAALPTSLAAKLAYPDRRVFMLTGDGSFGFNGMEFDTAVRHNLPIVAILGNDSAWGIDRQIQLGVYGKPVVTDLLPSRYDRVVEGLGGHGEHVESPTQIKGAIERAIHSGRPSLINVMVQRAISPRAETAIARWKSELALPF